MRLGPRADEFVQRFRFGVLTPPKDDESLGAQEHGLGSSASLRGGPFWGEGILPSHAPQGAVRAAHACPRDLRAYRRVGGRDALPPRARRRAKSRTLQSVTPICSMRVVQSAEVAGSLARREHGIHLRGSWGRGPRREGVSPSHAPQGAVCPAHACPRDLRACRRVGGRDALPKGARFRAESPTLQSVAGFVPCESTGDDMGRR